MKDRRKFLLLFFMVLFLSGCKRQQIMPPAVVTRVDIRCTHDGEQIHRSYVEQGQICKVLNCLRLQRGKGTAQVDPERVVGDVYEIRVRMSDGGEHIYRHRGGKYLSKDSRPWKMVDQEQSEVLYALLWNLY